MTKVKTEFMIRVRDVDVSNKLNEQFKKSGLKSFNVFINQILEDYVNRGYYFDDIYQKSRCVEDFLFNLRNQSARVALVWLRVPCHLQNVIH